MSKRSGKKEAKSLWHSSDKTGVKILQTKLDFYDKSDGTPIDGSILNEILYKNKLTNSLPPEIEMKDASSTYLQRFFFIPDSICAICNFTMGCNLLIECGEKKFIRSSWTISDKFLDEVFTISPGELADKPIVNLLSSVNILYCRNFRSSRRFFDENQQICLKLSCEDCTDDRVLAS